MKDKYKGIRETIKKFLRLKSISITEEKITSLAYQFNVPRDVMEIAVQDYLAEKRERRDKK